MNEDSADRAKTRLARLDDAPVLVAFNAAMALETEGKVLSPDIVAAGVRGLFERPERGFYRVAEGASGIVGALMITYEWSDWRNADFWWLQSVYVRPEARRTGVFTLLYRSVEAMALAAGACGLRLYVEQDNLRAQQTYRRLGMSEGHYRMMERSF
jgi:GNAT superfamily N-acetyltransferase